AATFAMTPGVAVNGVKFEPATAETVTCASGETLRVEALQDVYNLGLDFNNAHVQPTGEYHYHGISELLADAYATDEDLVHVGFAADGYLMYFSKSDAYASGYALSAEARSGTNCVGSGALRGADVAIDGTTPDGTYTSDWEWSDANGDLDECNGVEIDGEYAYVITDAYPYVGRCLNGEFTARGPGAGGAPPGAGGPPPGGPPPGGEPADAPSQG
ncbi:MAG: YHYH protein, partial [Ilumatobacter sp.]|nr:YHYH protein [Ilumatobacter sp.]